MRAARWLDLIGYAALVIVLLVVIVTQDTQRRQAEEAAAAATAEVQVLRSQQECSAQLQAQYDSALLAWLLIQPTPTSSLIKPAPKYCATKYPVLTGVYSAGNEAIR